MGKINCDEEVQKYLDDVANEFEGIESNGIVSPLWYAWNRIDKPRPYTSRDSVQIPFLREWISDGRCNKRRNCDLRCDRCR